MYSQYDEELLAAFLDLVETMIDTGQLMDIPSMREFTAIYEDVKEGNEFTIH